MFDPVYLFVYLCVSYIHIPQLKNILTESQLGFKFNYLRYILHKLIWEDTLREKLGIEKKTVIS